MARPSTATPTVTMGQKTSVQQSAQSVSKALTPDSADLNNETFAPYGEEPPIAKTGVVAVLVASMLRKTSALVAAIIGSLSVPMIVLK